MTTRDTSPDSTDTDSTGTATTPESSTNLSASEVQQMRLEFEWLPDAAFNVYLDAYIDTGDSSRAWIAVRQDKRYGKWFPGNLTDDGRPRYPEALYANTIAQYDDVMASVGLGEFFRPRYGEWIAGDVTPDEVEARVIPGYERITSQSQALKQVYAKYNGLEMTDRALLISFLDPKVGEEILTKKISMAEIGGEGLESGFNVNRRLAERMLEEGRTTRAQAESIFQRAESFMPILDVLAQRNDDPDDDFSLQEFVAADLFSDPEQQRRMRRLLAQERSRYTGGRRLGFSEGDGGGVQGLNVL